MTTPTDLRPEPPVPPVNPAFIEISPDKPDHFLFPREPFTNIAVAASGGGFRAAAYLLGTLSYLNHLQFRGKPLLKKVTYFASASGGSLATAFYRESLFRGQSFADYFKTMHDFLSGTETLKEVATLLADDGQWSTEGKRRNLINAFARVYDQKLDGLTLGDIYDANPDIPIREMCFNTTEFYQGLWFRFQTQPGGTSNLIGNRFLHFRRDGIELAKKIKIGDIIAASSCFPAGFEPMRFPDDFSHSGLSKTDLQDAIEFPNRLPSEIGHDYPHRTFGLMDGGIVDNQAVASMLRADSRRSNQPGACFNLAIITDVSNQYIPPFVAKELVADKQPWQERSITGLWQTFRGKLSWGLYAGILGLLLFMASLLAVILAPEVWMRITGALFIIPLLVVSWAGFRVNRLRKKSREWPTRLRQELTKRAPLLADNSIWSLLNFFANLPFGTLSSMLTDRIGSVVILASDLFLKRIRRADYQQLYEDPAWRFRLASNFIYDLSEGNQTNRDEQNKKSVKYGAQKDWRGDDADKLTPSGALAKVAETARLMETTLWFDETHSRHLGDVTATGQFTTCYNLIQYLCRLENQKEAYNQLTDDVKQAVEDLKIQLLADWANFQTNPLWLYDQYVREIKA